MAGYVSADKGPGGDVNQTPDYLNVRFLESRAAKGRGFSYPPDTGDRVVYQDEFVAWLESAFPDARRDAGAHDLLLARQRAGPLGLDPPAHPPDRQGDLRGARRSAPRRTPRRSRRWRRARSSSAR